MQRLESGVLSRNHVLMVRSNATALLLEIGWDKEQDESWNSAVACFSRRLFTVPALVRKQRPEGKLSR
jgi:hypothetical protein